MLLHHVYKTNVNEEKKLKSWSYSGISNQKKKQWKLIVWTSISLLTVSLYLSERNKRMSDNISSFRFFKKASKTSYLGVFLYFLQKMGNARRSGLLFQFISRNHTCGWEHLRNYDEIYVHLNDWILTVALMITLTPTGSWIAKIELCFKLKNSLNLRCLILLASLSKFVPVSQSSLYHWLTQKGKNNSLKCSILALNLLILFWSDTLLL